MKKIIIFLTTILICLISAIGLSSCSEEHDSSENPYIERFEVYKAASLWSLYVIVDTKTGAEYLVPSEGGIIKLEK